MKTSKLALIGVILATLVSVSSARSTFVCQLASMHRLLYSQNVLKCSQSSRMNLEQCIVKFQPIKDTLDNFEKKCHESNAK